MEILRLVSDDWKDYELIDAGKGERLERWGEFILRSPNRQAMWRKSANSKMWEDVHTHYHRSDTDGGNWEFLENVPERWKVRYRELSFYV